MPIFNYKAKDKKGKTKRGKVVSVDQERAVDYLSRRGLSVDLIKDSSDSVLNKIELFLNPIKKKDLVVFSRQFSIMIKSGVPTAESLATIVEQTDNIKFKNIISKISYDIDSGESLSNSLKKYPKFFSEFYCNVVMSGEVSGGLDESLEYLADETEKEYSLSKKFKSALIYPGFVFSGLLIVGIIFMFFVLPELIKVFEESGTELPLATRIVIAIINFFQNYYLLVLALIVGLIFLIKFILKTDAGKKSRDIIILKLPVIGKIFQLIYLVRFSRSLSTLLQAGVNINQSLSIVGGIIKNTIYKKIITRTADNVKEGGSVVDILDRSDFVPSMIPRMMSVGEKTGRLDETLEEVASFYEREVSSKLSNLNTIIEPVIMVIMAVGVGIMVAAIILPMYNMAGQF